MCSVLEIRPDDMYDYNHIKAQSTVNDLLQYLETVDEEISQVKKLSYNDLKTYGTDPYSAAEALCRQFDPSEKIYVHFSVTIDWSDEFDDTIRVLRERCYRVVSVRADWVGC